MTDKVVDASAVVAPLFNELTREAVVERLRGASLHAPLLLGFEVANACLKKMRANPGERQALLDAFSLLEELPIAPEAVDLTEAIVLAERTKLSLYDASYLWLAHALDAELVTLDDSLPELTKSCGDREARFDGIKRVWNPKTRAGSNVVSCRSDAPFIAPVTLSRHFTGRWSSALFSAPPKPK